MKVIREHCIIIRQQVKWALIGKDSDPGEDWRQKEKGWQRMRWLNSITNSMGTNLSKFQETVGFTDSSVGKESACNTGDSSSIPWSGRSPGEGIGNPLQYSWASLVVQLVKNMPAMQETWVWSLSWEDPLEMGKATHSSILAWRIPWTIHGVSKSQTQLSNKVNH